MIHEASHNYRFYGTYFKKHEINSLQCHKYQRFYNTLNMEQKIKYLQELRILNNPNYSDGNVYYRWFQYIYKILTIFIHFMLPVFWCIYIWFHMHEMVEINWP